jgi:hypothetical protein
MTRDTRRVKHPIRARRADVSEDVEHLPQGRLRAIGEPIVIEPMEELHILRWPSPPDDLALVSCRGSLHLIAAYDLEHGTMRVFRAGHS